MPPHPYVYERELELWTSNSAERFFEDHGFDVAVYPIDQLNERWLPTDHLFVDNTTKKIFGFQYKALYHNGTDFWKLDKGQHAELQGYEWIYYGLSEVSSGMQRRDALNRLVVAPASFVYDSRLARDQFVQLGIPHFRWDSFFDGLVRCKYGRKVNSRQELKDALWPSGVDVPNQIERIANDVFVVDVANERVAMFSSVPR